NLYDFRKLTRNRADCSYLLYEWHRRTRLRLHPHRNTESVCPTTGTINGDSESQRDHLQEPRQRKSHHDLAVRIRLQPSALCPKAKISSSAGNGHDPKSVIRIGVAINWLAQTARRYV